MTTLGPDDRIAILDLIANYAYAWDGKDADAYSNLFLEDGISELYFEGGATPERRIQSRAALRTYAAESFAGRLLGVQTRHHQGSIVIAEVQADSARGKTLVLVTHQRPEEAAPRLAFSGVYHDVFANTASGWKFARRTAYIVGVPAQSRPEAAPT